MKIKGYGLLYANVGLTKTGSLNLYEFETIPELNCYFITYRLFFQINSLRNVRHNL